MWIFCIKAFLVPCFNKSQMKETWQKCQISTYISVIGYDSKAPGCPVGELDQRHSKSKLVVLLCDRSRNKILALFETKCNAPLQTVYTKGSILLSMN